MISDELRQKVAPYLTGRQIPWQSINLHVGRLPEDRASVLQAPHVMVRRRVMAVTALGKARSLVTVGIAMGRDIYIDPRYADFDTAAGLSLAVHELVHVDQHERDPSFLAKYQKAAKSTPDDRPWENVYEAEAYQAERVAYCDSVAHGFPRGKWTPLGVTLWGCG